MNCEVKRIFVEKKPGFDVEGQHLCKDFREILDIIALDKVRIINRYDVAGIDEQVYREARNTIFSEPPVDDVYDEVLPLAGDEHIFAVEFLPGQYDQRADSAAQCIQILTQGERPVVAAAKVIVLMGDLTAAQIDKIKQYYINPVESREASLDKPETLDVVMSEPEDVQTIENFIVMDEQELQAFAANSGFAMSIDDLQFCQTYFREEERRNPTITELKMIDTYWSDHCRHTTFMTEIEDISFAEDERTLPIRQAFEQYVEAREFVYGTQERAMCLMDLAVIGMKELRKLGKLEDLDVSEEINACSIVVPVEVEGVTEDWLVMFKNETHNHPTEIEPFGGAATCLGGAIRDPLSGRSYVYQAMRVTGSGDPRASINETLPGKLPQRKITTEAAAGYSSYGNQIGLATGFVEEIYHEGYVAKRMEVGAVIAAAPKENVVREVPEKGDLVILAGGRTGRDGCGGATGSSKEHDEESLFACGAEVQKGNPPTERKLQRLFRNPQVSKMIKRCNDFGAGGVSVAIGELTDGIDVNLDVVPKKYEGLDGTELAISESQERMAVVVAAEDAPAFIEMANVENVEATIVAEVTDSRRLRMFWRGKAIVDLSRDFLDTNGVKQKTTIHVAAPGAFEKCSDGKVDGDLREQWIQTLESLNVCSQKGLVERFDSSIGAGTVLMPFGGEYQATPIQGMVAKIPVLHKETSTGTIMTYGYNPEISSISPFHGAMYAVVESIAKIVAIGGDYRTTRLTFQEYFEKLGQDAAKWGKPFSALLGAYHAQKQLEVAAIGGKDSMSGSFKDLHVPPTLISFAVDPVNVENVISPEFKNAGSQIIYIRANRDEQNMIDFQQLKANFAKVTELIANKVIVAAYAITSGGIAEAISKMAFGNRIGAKLCADHQALDLFAADYGSFVVEVAGDAEQALGSVEALFAGVPFEVIGHTIAQAELIVGDMKLDLQELYHIWSSPLESIFPTQVKTPVAEPFNTENTSNATNTETIPAEVVLPQWNAPVIKAAKPRVIIPVFPGTNCEYDTQRAFEQAGAIADTFVIRNLTSADIEESIEVLAQKISQAQIVMLPGGFSGGDEPEGSGKFYATLFRNPRIAAAVMELLQQRDGLMLGICNGFQALIKLGLLPYGEIRNMTSDSPTLTYNQIGRHVSCMVRTKVVSRKSPWLYNVEIGDIHQIPVSHGEGRLVAPEGVLRELFANGQVATQYVDDQGTPSYAIEWNPNGSMHAIEGITSPDGRIFGKMGHSERIGRGVAKNISGNKDQQLFVAGVRYFQ